MSLVIVPELTGKAGVIGWFVGLVPTNCASIHRLRVSYSMRCPHSCQLMKNRLLMS